MKKIQHYMVVDDDATNNMICEFTIKRYDKEAEIKLFTDPEKALGFIQKDYDPLVDRNPTILFLDLNMPTMTGWEFLDVFTNFDPWVKERFLIYILSSSIEDSTKEAEIYTFIQGFLSKPLKLSNLEEILMNQVNSKML